MLVRRGQSQRSPCLVIGAIVAITLLIACGIIAVLLAFGVAVDIDGGEETSGPTATLQSAVGETVIAVLDVDQGQAVLIVAPDGSAALIDAGRSQTRIREEITPYAETLGVAAIEYLILSHPDQDHVGGMPEVLELYAVANWVDPGIPTTNQTYEESIGIVLDVDIAAIMARQGEEFVLGENVRLRLLWPVDDFIETSGEPDANENSVVVLVSVGAVDILIPGDLEERGEEALVNLLAGDLQAEILVAGHHGSNTSSTAEFLDAVAPEVAIISAGEDNPYGHPHDEVLQRLRFRAVEIYRTDLDGTVEVRTDGAEFTIATIETDTDP